MYPPIIMTATLDDAAQETFNRQRRAHFPAERNILDAHITLFHKLPGPQLTAIRAELASLPGTQPFAAETSGVRYLGRGVAYDVECTPLIRLRETLAGRWRMWLSPQDMQGFKPHITVQNKAEAAAAKALHMSLSSAFIRLPFQITGLTLWHYLNGPWGLIEHTLFDGP